MDLNIGSLDPNEMGSWPVTVKAVIVALIFIITVGLGVWLDTIKQVEQLDQLRGKEQQLRKTFEQKQGKAVNLEAYKKQLAEMKRSFGTMLRQLPSKTEVADLLVDISQTGLASGLEFQLFQPSNERPVEFYAELPIKLEMTGYYHEFGKFVSGIAALPRIVTLHNFSIKPVNINDDLLKMTATAKTYRYLDEDEQAVLRKGKQQPKKKGRKR